MTDRMTQCAFLVDHIFRTDQSGNVLTMGGKFPYTTWEPYIKKFGRVHVIARGQAVNGDELLSVSSGPDVSFTLLPAKRGAARITERFSRKRLVSDALAKATHVVARLPSELGLDACAICEKWNIPYQIELVACPWDALRNHGTLAARLYAPVLAHRTKTAVAKAPSVRYVTEKFLQSRYPSRGKNFVASNVALPQHRLPSRPSEPATILKFGTIGALHTDLKGVGTALHALSIVRKNLNNLPFIYEVVGEGDPSRFKELADTLGLAEQVRFVGVKRAGEEIFRWLDQVDIYLQPSFQEGLPRATIEAMSRGCRCIGSTAGGIPELLAANRLHAPGDHAALARRIEDCIASSAESAAQESSHNRTVSERYEWASLYPLRMASLDYLLSGQ
ncbi:glycosyltransferase [Altererythrobacter indicus]|uniref:Glycosyltransferase n=1 Tax=Altericroceibacterium indicum TaxID=374177 RepID=A0A845A9U5_9SPHN|nr:glycosyltransferase [Altericroceibacterium indicum]MXP27020.1 glycosyltransferase [Altericroceibacterium indicum]